MEVRYRPAAHLSKLRPCRPRGEQFLQQVRDARCYWKRRVSAIHDDSQCHRLERHPSTSAQCQRVKPFAALRD
jgi:hypothetical protein